MKVTTERLEKSQVALQVEVEPDVLEKSLERAYRRIVNRTNIPGFRRGKAPRVMVERLLGKAVLLEEALDLMVPEVYNQAIEQEAIAAIGRPSIEILQVEPEVSFKATVAIEPTVELGDATTLSLTMEVERVTDAAVDEAVAGLREMYAEWEPVDRPVAFGDMVILAIDSSLLDGDARQPFVIQKEATYIVTAGRREPVPDFAEALVGQAKAETREFNLPIPEDPEKKVEFKVTVNEIKEKREPALDVAFAKKVDEQHASYQEMVDKVRANLVERAERGARSVHDLAMLDALAAISTLEYPDMMVDHEIEHIIETDRSLPRDPQGRIDNVLKVLGQTMEEFKERFREPAQQRVVRSLVLRTYAQDAAVEVTPEEMAAEVETMARGFGGNEDAYRDYLITSESAQESIRNTLMSRKTLERLFEVTSTRVEVDPKLEEPAAEAEESPEGPAPSA